MGKIERRQDPGRPAARSMLTQVADADSLREKMSGKRGRPPKKNNKKAIAAAANARRGSGKARAGSTTAKDPPSYKPRGEGDGTRESETPSELYRRALKLQPDVDRLLDAESYE